MTEQEAMIQGIKTHGKKVRGQANFIKHLRCKRLTQRQAIEAHCYHCQGYGEFTDCDTDTCSLFPFSSYGKKYRENASTCSRTGIKSHLSQEVMV